MLIKKILYLCFCIIAGSATAAGFVAFITLLGVFQKLIEKYKTAKYIRIIETAIISGVTLFNLVYLYELSLPFNNWGMSIFCLSGGIFVGCLAGALAETLNIFPILSRRFKIRKWLPYVLIAAAIGKACGSLVQLLNF
ncbi:MAG: stage V sporulation protein AB [Lachnospiraceae bacterium]|nr:stage V sporulation protein AB [Lachnospiraceae bacterium]